MNMKQGVELSNVALKPNKARTVYSFFIAIIPVVASYASGVPGFSLADVLLVFFTGYAMFFSNRVNNSFSVKIGSLMVGLFLILLFNLLSFANPDTSVYAVTIRTVRYFFYIFCFVYTSRRLIDIGLLKKYIKYTAILATIFVFVQFILYKVFGYVLPGFISQLGLYVSDYASRDYEALYRHSMYRPTSFFLEPAHYSRYAIIGLILLLWDSNLEKKGFMWAVVLSLGVILSTSSQGYVLLFLVWVLFLLMYNRYTDNPFVKNINKALILCSPLLIYGVLKIPAVQETIARSTAGGLDKGSSAVGARLGGIRVIQNLPVFELLFGNGFGSIPDGQWLSSAWYWIYGSGIIVFAVYMFFMLSTLLKLKGYQKIIHLCFFLLFFTDDSFYSYMSVLFLSVSLLQEKKMSQEKNNEELSVYSNRIRVG